MKISLKVDYACRVMAELARSHGSGGLAQIEQLAEAEAVPPSFLAQILLKLRDSGLITSRRGNQGGYTLARSPDEISLYDILVGLILSVGSPAAVVNAVVDALAPYGVRHADMPLTPSRVWEAMQGRAAPPQ